MRTNERVERIEPHAEGFLLTTRDVSGWHRRRQALGTTAAPVPQPFEDPGSGEQRRYTCRYLVYAAGQRCILRRLGIPGKSCPECTATTTGRRISRGAGARDRRRPLRRLGGHRAPRRRQAGLLRDAPAPGAALAADRRQPRRPSLLARIAEIMEGTGGGSKRSTKPGRRSSNHRAKRSWRPWRATAPGAASRSITSSRRSAAGPTTRCSRDSRRCACSRSTTRTGSRCTRCARTRTTTSHRRPRPVRRRLPRPGHRAGGDRHARNDLRHSGRHPAEGENDTMIVDVHTHPPL